MRSLFPQYLTIWRSRPCFGGALVAWKTLGLAVQYSMVTITHLNTELKARSMQHEGPTTGQLRPVFSGFLRFQSKVRGQSKKIPNFFFLIYCCTYNLIRLVSFKVLPSTADTPLPAFFPFWNVSWNMFCGMARRSCSEFSFISSTVSNRQPFRADFNFWNRKKSAGAKSGE